MQKISSPLVCIEPNNPAKRAKALARLFSIRAKKPAVYVDAVDALGNDFGSFFESLSCSPSGGNDAPRSVTVPGVSGPRVGATTAKPSTLRKPARREPVPVPMRSALVFAALTQSLSTSQIALAL